MSKSYVLIKFELYKMISFIELVAVHSKIDFSTNAWNIALKYGLNLA